eukprot:403359277
MEIDEDNSSNLELEQQVQEHLQQFLLFPPLKYLTQYLKSLNISSSQSINPKKLNKLQDMILRQDLCQLQDYDQIPPRHRLVPAQFEQKHTIVDLTDESRGTYGILVQVQKIINIGMPQKNQDDDNNHSDEENENDNEFTQNTQISQYRIEKFENKYLESAQLDAKKRNNKEQNRMFKLLLTDGKTDIIAIELEKIYSLNLDNTQIGSKLRLQGVIEVRRGIYMLRNDNVEVLWNNKENPQFKTTGSTGFNQITESLLNPKSFERKGLLQKRKRGEDDGGGDKIGLESEKIFKQKIEEMVNNQKNFKYQDQIYNEQDFM